MRGRWTKMQVTNGKAILEIADQVLEENLDIEMSLSPLNADGMPSISIAGDGRWDKRGSGRKKDSLSGCSFFNGNLSKLTVGLEPMSQTCIKCSKGVDHDISVCPKNYVGSSKGMEATGSARITKRLFEAGKVVIGEHVGDDDSSCRMVMRHSFQELIDAGKMQLADWPRYNGKSKGKKPDNGLLPVDHPPIVFRADKGHQVRNYVKFFFALSVKPKKERKRLNESRRKKDETPNELDTSTSPRRC